MNKTLEKINSELARFKCTDCRHWVHVQRWAYDVMCQCGARYNSVGQRLTRYCCSVSENGYDCGHGEGD